ncbi:MAG TPA: CHAD domain-containing protein [Terracidiphilus sp.]|jgi:CHAD domain-containing protein|nr:CHAD domain-containing protein [Terracidiphilus sp.]
MAIAFDRMEKPLRRLRKLLRKLPANPAPAAVHKLRTRARQVEAIAMVLPPCGEKRARRLLKSIQSLRRAAGGVRDMDVLAGLARTLPLEIQREAVTCLIDPIESHLDASRKKYAAELAEMLERRRKTTREHLRLYAKQLQRAKVSASVERHAEQQAQSLATHLAAELERWPALTAGNLHAFRLKVKELRSVLQLSNGSDRAVIDALGAAKDAIGAWHDWQLLYEAAAELPATQLMGGRQDRDLLAGIEAAADEKLRAALSAAGTLRSQYFERAAQHLAERPRKKPPTSERPAAGHALTGRPNRAA